MSLRDEFEKLCPVPARAKWDEDARTYIGGDNYRIAAYRSMYQGFLLGRRNTVSVERYKQHVDEAHWEGFCTGEFCGRTGDTNSETAWDNSQAKRRTEEV